MIYRFRLTPVLLCAILFSLASGTAYSYSVFEDQLFIDGYKKVLSSAAINLKNKKVRLRADIIGYEDSEEARKLLDRFKEEIKLHLKEEYQIDLVSFVPVFFKKKYMTKDIVTPIVEFSLFADERLALPYIAEDADDESILSADLGGSVELDEVKETLEPVAKAPVAAAPDISDEPAAKKLVPRKLRVEAKKVYSENELKSRKHNRLGVGFYKRGRYELAFPEFIDALIVDPDNMQARFNLGVAYQMQGRYGEAIVAFQKALSIEDLPRIHVMLGAVYIMQERYNDAMEELKNVVFFGTGKQRLGLAGVQAIKQFAKAVKNTALRIEGHADSRGTEEVNKPLSVGRAIAVAMELIAMNNVEPDFVFIRGLGETDPVAPNNSEAGRRINRRVEMSIHKQKELY